VPEFWLNYGTVDVVLAIRAENLKGEINTTGVTLGYLEIAERLKQVPMPLDLVLLHDSDAVRQIVSSLFQLCAQKSVPPPTVLADSSVIRQIKNALPEGAVISEFADAAGRTILPRTGIPAGGVTSVPTAKSVRSKNLVFVAEAEFDGLFGCKTIATRLLKRFGADSMLLAYTKRDGNTPSSGRRPGSFDEAVKFADSFDIWGIEIAANSGGISEIFVGHPSETAVSVAERMRSTNTQNVQPQRAVVISTGRPTSSSRLAGSLWSLGNCHECVRGKGVCVLAAECTYGLGSDAILMYVEGRLQEDTLRDPPSYIDGMEDLLFLSEMKKRYQLGLVSILPRFYTRRLGIVPLDGMSRAMEYIFKTCGASQKISIVSDGARTLLLRRPPPPPT